MVGCFWWRPLSQVTCSRGMSTPRVLSTWRWRGPRTPDEVKAASTSASRCGRDGPPAACWPSGGWCAHKPQVFHTSKCKCRTEAACPAGTASEPSRRYPPRRICCTWRRAAARRCGSCCCKVPGKMQASMQCGSRPRRTPPSLRPAGCAGPMRSGTPWKAAWAWCPAAKMPGSSRCRGFCGSCTSVNATRKVCRAFARCTLTSLWFIPWCRPCRAEC
ncbi:unnamed protein product [Effrenium voratum]|nr:unnamed protein product [Effrenium voratum]